MKRSATLDQMFSTGAVWHAVVDGLRPGVALISPQMEILALNAQMKRWFPAVEETQHPICHRAFNTPPRPEVCSYCPTIKTLQDGQVHEAVTATPTGDTVINFRVVASPITDEQGKVIAAVEMVEDVTAQTKAAAELHLLSIALAGAVNGVGIADMQGRQLYANDAFCRMLGRPREELIGQLVSVVDPENAPPVMEAIRREGSLNSEIQIRRPDGTRLTVQSTATLVRDDQGSPIAQMVSFVDITERKRLDEELRLKDAALASSLNGVALGDLTGHQIYVNDALCRMLGMTREEVMLRPGHETFPDAGRMLEAIQREGASLQPRARAVRLRGLS